MRVSIAIDDADRSEPVAIQSPDHGNPVELEPLLLKRFIGTQPALFDPCIPDEIALLRRDKPCRQRFRGAAPEFQFEPCHERRHHAMRTLRNRLKHGHENLLSLDVFRFEDSLSTAVAGVPVRAAGA